ncbi:hypothetical protein DSECCO2_447580 [anaerobic digester metagenome]
MAASLLAVALTLPDFSAFMPLATCNFAASLVSSGFVVWPFMGLGYSSPSLTTTQ